MIGWLESLPDAPLRHFILPNGPKAPSERAFLREEEREPFRRQAESDLRHFYRSRAHELVPDGKLLVQVFGRDGQGSTSDGIYDVLSDALLDLIDQGELPAAFYERLKFPVYFRTLQELVDPIESDPDLARSFRVEKSGAFEIKVPFNEERARTGDAKAWARSYTGFFRAVSEPVVSRAMQQQGLPIELLEEIYRRIEALLIADQGRYEFRYVAIGTLLTRV
jgi:hypothetical protein